MKRGEFLSDKRIEKGFSVFALAQKLGISEEVVERWEGGELPDSEYLLPLSALLGVSVEEILQDGEECSVKEDGAGNKPESCVDLQETQDAARCLFSEAKSPAEEQVQKTAPPQVSYYDRLHKKIGELEYSSDRQGLKESENGNGYTPAERKFGYTLFVLFAVIMLVSLSFQFFGWVGRPRELTAENYGNYLEIDVIPATNSNPDEYIVRVTAKQDISDLSITLEIRFWTFVGDDFTEQVTLSGSPKKNDTIEQSVALDDFAFERGYILVSVKGGLS